MSEKRARKLRLWPRSLLGQMLLAVAMALLVGQTISGVLAYRAQEQWREIGMINSAAFRLATAPRRDFREFNPRYERERPNPRRWRWLQLEREVDKPTLLTGEERNPEREKFLAEVLGDQGVNVGKLMVVERDVRDDPFVVALMQTSPRLAARQDLMDRRLLVAALQREGETDWQVARVPVPAREPRTLQSLIAQTLILYIVLVGGLALLLRRITRPLAVLTRRVERFGVSLPEEAPLEPSGPEDTRRLIAAHNAMEARIAALLDEKDVMLGAIGHDLKTPLAALRVRIENVADDTQRAKMAATIEDITRSLDDILSLARVGRPSDPLEKTDLAALVASVVEEFEDMGEPVELGTTDRISMPLRTTWLRRGIRNLTDNAVRYGKGADVSLKREGNEAVIRIVDSGPGIPEGELETMLQPFTRGEASRSRETGGAGLGLTLARAIAEQHGGRLVLTNRRAADGRIEGLEASIRLPIV